MDKINSQLEAAGIVEMPFSTSTELAIIGACVLDPNLIPTIIEQVRSEYFYHRENKMIFTEVHKLFMMSIPCDLITLLEAIMTAGVFSDEQTAKEYLNRAAETMPSLSNINYYTNILKDRFLVRQLIDTSYETLRQTQEGIDSELLLESAEQRIYELRQGRDNISLKHISQAVAASFDRLSKMAGGEREKYLGVKTHFEYLDAKLTGMGGGDFIIVAARPGMGKTSFAINIATNVASVNKIPVAIFSLEMSNEQLSERIMSSEALIDSNDIHSGNIKENQWEAIGEVAGRISDMPIYIDDSSSITVSEMKAKIRKLNQDPQKDNIGLIVIDYIQLMSSGKRTESRVQEVSEITRNLKVMAKELNVPVIALSQLSRSAEKGTGKDSRPQLSDLRDSGSIEQDADVVMFLYREGYYSQSPEVVQTQAECIIAKNRHGETGKVYIGWDGAHTRFYNIDYVHKEDDE